MEFNDQSLQRFLKMHINQLPSAYAGIHSQKITMIQFILGSMDLSDSLDCHLTPQTKSDIIEWVYSLQSPDGGFFGCNDCLLEPDAASTFSAIACLLTLGDPLKGINIQKINRFFCSLRAIDGGFCQFPCMRQSHSDLRFLYCVVVARYILGIKWDSSDVDAAVKYIISLQNYEGGFGSIPNAESHGGYTYCAVSALYLLDRLSCLTRRDEIISWCIRRQNFGFSGRCGKMDDTCYSFWIGATLKLLDAYSFISPKENLNFLIQMQSQSYGGLRKDSESQPDLMHTYLGLAGFSLCYCMPPVGSNTLLVVDPALNITYRAADDLKLRVHNGE